MKKLLVYLFCLVAFAASAQTTTRIKLTQIEKSNTVNGTKANQVPVSNGVGDLRYSQYTEINPTPIGYTPAATGNPSANYAQFVTPANGDVWYIDNEGRGIRLYVAAAAGDYDWLEIGNNMIPNSINDSIYKYKYASIGGRLVWPTAEMLVIDSVAQGMFMVAGDRKAKVALYDTNNQTWCTLEQGGGTTALIMQDQGTFSIQTAGSGTPQAPGTPIVEHFNILGDSSIQFPQYPNTRLDSGTPTVVFGPDATGKMKNYPAGTLNGVVTSGPLTGSGSSLFPVTMLNSGVTPGSYTSSDITVDAFGRVTAAANGSGGGGIGGTIAANQVAVGSGANTIGGSSALTFTSGNLSVTGNVSISGTGRNTFSPTVTTTASGDYGNGLFGTITGSGTAGHRVVGTSISPLITAGGNNQVMTALEVSGSYTPGAFTGTTRNIAAFRDAGVNRLLIKPDSLISSTPNFLTANSASSIPAKWLTGTWFTGGGTTNTKPHFFIEPSTVTTSNAWNNSGTGLGINAATGFAGNLIDLQLNGNARFSVSSGGIVTASNTIQGFGNIITAAGGNLSWAARSIMTSPSNGIILFQNQAGTDFIRLQYGGTTSSFPAEKRNGATIETRLADDSGFAATQSLYDRFGSGSPESVVTAPVGAVYHRIDGGAGTSFYVKESGTGNTGWVAK